jgi:hypothetical protein
MVETEDIKQINRNLEEQYGRDVALNLPNFRVVWSNYTEKRYGEFARFSDEGVYLRTEAGVFEEPKYLGVCSDKWVLEELKSTKGNPYLEMVVPYSYEPVWVFGSGKSNPQPIWRAVQILMLARLHGDPNNKIKTASDVADEDAKKLAREKADCKVILQDTSPYLPGQLHDGGAVTVPHNYEKQETKAGENV